MDATQVLGLAAGVFTAIGSLPQIIKAVRTKSVGDVSIWTYVTLMTGTTLWTIYGSIKMDWPIIITNGVSSILNGIMIYCCYVFKIRSI